MSTVAPPLMTVEDFQKLPDPPDGSRQELVKGVVITMPPPKTLHGFCCSKVNRFLTNFAEEQGLGMVTCNDTGFLVARSPDTVRAPDVAFWHRDRSPDLNADEYTSIPPDLAVEVVSPEDSHSRLLNKVVQYLKCGVNMIWVVDPEICIVTVHRSRDKSQVLENGDTLSGDEVLPGFSC